MKIMPAILGEEFKCINKITANMSATHIGDDCAVIKHDCKSKTLYSIDSFIEDVHFKSSYFTAFQIGYKAVQAAISDIAAMGGTATYVLVALSLPSARLIPLIMKGVKDSLKIHNIELIGGDITYGRKISISVSVIGNSNGKPVMRYGAGPGDLLYVTGYTGLSGAGLYALHHGIKGYEKLKRAQKMPSARLDISKKLSKIASSMIDISDGLNSELVHICHQSNVSYVLQNIPFHPELLRFCEKYRLNPETFVLNGGEDYELLYTVPPRLKNRALGFCIGEIISVSKNKKRDNLTGFKHFK